MTTNYSYQQKELGSRDDLGEAITEPQNWSGISEGEKIHLLPEPELPYAARKSGDDMIVHGAGGECLDANHESTRSVDPIAGETRKVKMRCP